jgi:nitric oxide reductase subunit B
VLVFCLRSLAADAAWARAERWIKLGFWGLNAGLALMIGLDLFPAGVLQLSDSITNGYWHARQPAFTMTGLFHALEWTRLFGDGVFLVAGVVPICAATLFLVLGRDARGSSRGPVGAWRAGAAPPDHGVGGVPAGR